MENMSEKQIKLIEEAISENSFAAAEAEIRLVLADNPNNALALYYYGLVAYRVGKLEEAIQLLNRAVDLMPDNARFRNLFGFLLRVAKYYDQAKKQLEKAIELDPENAESYNNLGIVCFEQNNIDGALSMYNKALAIKPDQPDILNNIGNAFASKQMFDEAIASYDTALAINPKYVQALSNKAETILRNKGINEEERKSQYRDCIETAAGIAPNWLELQNKFANLLSSSKELDKAEEVLRSSLNLLVYEKKHIPLMLQLARVLDQKFELDEALQWGRQAYLLDNDNIYTLQVLGHISLRIGHPLEALSFYKRGLELRPDIPDLHYGLGNVFMRLERLQEAMDCYLKVHEMDPSNPRGVFAPAACLLLNGEYEKGWAAYESRYRVDGFKPNVPDVMHRLWDGRPLGNAHVVVHVEQGFGDTFQFCRYLQTLREKQGPDCKITFLCEPETYRLLANIKGPDQVYSLAEKIELSYDVQIPLMSLPHRLKTTIQNVPSPGPYISVPDTCKKIVSNIPDTYLKVGIVWAGRPTHSDDRYRSISMEMFSRLFAVEEVAFYALQWGERANDLQPYLTKHKNVVDDREGLKDFADTAGFIDELDLVIAVDTSVAHLAGAMGKPVWTLIPYGAEWRWLLGHERTPWYQ
ncbi:MAG: tetratricopeptide repeat protein, partial [Alphaproteobacteria bacterium]|nr:tetratricopeptide repeat protein [Alphaproteobacteria bacterium]